MSNIPIGAKLEQTEVVTSNSAINFLGLEGARVLSTPKMIGFMERASRDAVLPFLDLGQDTVGTHVNVYHLAAAPMGATVTFHAEITRADEKRVQFRVEAWSDSKKIGEGTHERAIIDVARFASKHGKKED